MYDDALARGDGAFLLDQERPNIFTLSVGSLPAGAEAVVEIEYVALLDQRGREVRFSLPTTSQGQSHIQRPASGSLMENSRALLTLRPHGRSFPGLLKRTSLAKPRIFEVL